MARSPAPNGRIQHVDALRAVAAIAVALFHFQAELPSLRAALPEPLSAVFAHGYLGVNVFFVLSGFVIAHSLRDARYSPGFVARFALRRSLRLDPPYWVTVGLAAVVVANRADNPMRVTFAGVAAHVLYLQGILGYSNFIDVFWTLCIEIQLYLAFCLLGWLAQAAGEVSARSWKEDLLAVTTLGSVALPLLTRPEPWGAWFVIYWYQFALGVWTYRAASSRAARVWLALTAAAAFGSAVRFGDVDPVVCAVTACVLAIARTAPGVDRVPGLALFAALGRCSYSFYLLHALVGVGFLRRWNALTSPGVAHDVVGVGLAFVVSFVASEALFRVVERPSLALSRCIRTRGTTAAAEPLTPWAPT